MKNNLLFSVLLLGLGLTACQNKSQDSETNDSISDSNFTMIDTIASRVDTSSMMPDMNDESMFTEMEKAANKMVMAIRAVNMTGNLDRDLILMLKPHHQAAIDIAKLELKLGSEDVQHRIARNMIQEKSKEIKMLDVLLSKEEETSKEYDPSNKTSGLGKSINDIRTKLATMPSLTGIPDHDFTNFMLKYYRDELEVVSIISKNSKNPELKTIVNTGKADHLNLIQQLKKTVGDH